MKFEKVVKPSKSQGSQIRAQRPVGMPWLRVAAGIVSMSALLAAALHSQQSGHQTTASAADQETTSGRSWESSQLKIPEPQNAQQDFAAANAERRKQIADDSARLLKLATDLKSEVDKTTKDTLSLNVIRKADEIEKLAHTVKEKMKLTAGAS